MASEEGGGRGGGSSGGEAGSGGGSIKSGPLLVGSRQLSPSGPISGQGGHGTTAREKEEAFEEFDRSSTP
jgi:hypothetical protein